MFYLPVYLCTIWVHGVEEGQQRASESLGLEKQSDVSCEVNSGNWTRVLWRSNQCSYPLSRPSSLPVLVSYFWSVTLRNIRILIESSKVVLRPLHECLIKILDTKNVIINWSMPGNKTTITDLSLKRPLLSCEWTHVSTTWYSMNLKNSSLIFSPMISSWKNISKKLHLICPRDPLLFVSTRWVSAQSFAHIPQSWFRVLPDIESLRGGGKL